QTQGKEIQHLLQAVAAEKGSDLRVRNTIIGITVEVGRQAANGGPALRLESSNRGSNYHIELIDMSARFEPGKLDPRIFQGGQGAGEARRKY
ncbi:hypothetical protein ABTD59_18775, partial [Acinetobacter baumannii]